MASEWDPDFEYFVSWSRCRIANKAILLSDIVTPDGKCIDSRYLDGSVMEQPPLSALEFGEERPCERDWEVWRDFWSSQTYPGFVLPTSLDPWICPSHRQHEWYYNEATDQLIHHTAGGGAAYKRTEAAGLFRLRRQQKFHRLGLLPSVPDLSDFLPCSVTILNPNEVLLGTTGPQRYDPPATKHDLISLLKSWGGYHGCGR